MSRGEWRRRRGRYDAIYSCIMHNTQVAPVYLHGSAGGNCFSPRPRWRGFPFFSHDKYIRHTHTHHVAACGGKEFVLLLRAENILRSTHEARAATGESTQICTCFGRTSNLDKPGNLGCRQGPWPGHLVWAGMGARGEGTPRPTYRKYD